MRRKKDRFLLLFALSMLSLMFVVSGEKAMAANALSSEFDGGYGYSTLTKNQKESYTKIVEEMERFHRSTSDAPIVDGHYVAATIELSKLNITLEELNKIMFAINADHPRYFWYEGTSYTYGEGKRNRKASKAKTFVSQISVTVLPDYAKGSARNSENVKLYQAVKKYTAVLDGMKRRNAKTLELEKYIHDELIKNIAYGNARHEDENTVVGAFVNRIAVCEGYAKAFQLLANYAKVESIYAVGYGYEDGHAWNLVKVDGHWYNMDVAWDDAWDGISYRYFNCLDDVFLVSHVYSSDFVEMYPVPKVTKSNVYEYYEYNHLNLDSYDYKSNASFRSKIQKAVNAAQKEGLFVLEFQVKEKEQAKFKQMWKANEAAIRKNLKKNGTFYEFSGVKCTEDVVTNSNQVVYTYEISLRKYSVIVPKEKTYFEKPTFSLCMEQEGNKKTTIRQTTSQYKNGKLTIYYKGSSVGTYNVSVKAPVVSKICDYTYRGTKYTPRPTVMVGKTKLKRNVDYTLSYSNNKDAGKAKVTITGIGKYSGKKTVTFNIKKRSVGALSFSKVKNQKFKARWIRPSVTVKQNGIKLVKNKDYKVRYYRNWGRGTARIVISGTGKNYMGQKTIHFKIV